MSDDESVRSGATRKRRRRHPLNIPRLKSRIVFGIGTVTALVSGVTGLGAQVAFAPMLTWMLGFAPEKAQGTATAFGVWTALAAVLAAVATGAVPSGFVLAGVVLMVGALVGALGTASLAKKVQSPGYRRTFQTLGLMITLAVVVQIGHLGRFDNPHLHSWNSYPALFGMAVLIGGVTQLMGLISGLLLIPALYLFGGYSGANSIALSLLVVTLASILPGLSYGQRGLIDTQLGRTTMLAGLLGGFCGGLLLTHMQDKLLIIFSAVIAMFWCARELSRLAFSPNENEIEPDGE